MAGYVQHLGKICNMLTVFLFVCIAHKEMTVMHSNESVW